MFRHSLAAAAFALLFATLAPAGARAASQTLFDSTMLVPPSSTVGTSGYAVYDNTKAGAPSPFVIASRGTLTASITPSVFGAALDNLSFNLLTSTQKLSLQYNGSGAFTGSIDLEPGNYFFVASGTTRATPGQFSGLGFFGLKIEFSPSAAAVVPLPGAAGLLAAFLGAGALFGRRRRALPEDAPEGSRADALGTGTSPA